jgi:hypothetical protein
MVRWTELAEKDRLELSRPPRGIVDQDNVNTRGMNRNSLAANRNRLRKNAIRKSDSDCGPEKHAIHIRLSTPSVNHGYVLTFVDLQRAENHHGIQGQRARFRIFNNPARESLIPAMRYLRTVEGES